MDLIFLRDLMQSYLTSMKFPSACSRHNLSEGPWFSTYWEIQQNLCPLQLMMPGWWSYIDLVQVAPVSGHFGVLSLWFHSGLNPITAEWTLNACPGEHDGMAKTWFSRTSAARHWWKSLAPVDIQKMPVCVGLLSTRRYFPYTVFSKMHVSQITGYAAPDQHPPLT